MAEADRSKSETRLLECIFASPTPFHKHKNRIKRVQAGVRRVCILLGNPLLRRQLVGDVGEAGNLISSHVMKKAQTSCTGLTRARVPISRHFPSISPASTFALKDFHIHLSTELVCFPPPAFAAFVSQIHPSLHGRSQEPVRLTTRRLVREHCNQIPNRPSEGVRFCCFLLSAWAELGRWAHARQDSALPALAA